MSPMPEVISRKNGVVVQYQSERGNGFSRNIAQVAHFTGRTSEIVEGMMTPSSLLNELTLEFLAARRRGTGSLDHSELVTKKFGVSAGWVRGTNLEEWVRVTVPTDFGLGGSQYKIMTGKTDDQITPEEVAVQAAVATCLARSALADAAKIACSLTPAKCRSGEILVRVVDRLGPDRGEEDFVLKGEFTLLPGGFYVKKCRRLGWTDRNGVFTPPLAALELPPVEVELVTDWVDDSEEARSWRRVPGNNHPHV